MRKLAALVAVIVLTACEQGGNPAPSPEPLATDQTLGFPIAQDVADLDPALISSPADVDIFRNVFSGLYTFDSKLHEVPDLAVGQPDVSPDGLIYTFHIRHGAQFSNGDAITAGDFVFSWSRTVSKQGDFAGLFDIVAGYGEVASGRSSQLSGLVKVDDYTLQVTLAKRAGFFQVLTGLWPFWIVDQNVIASAGDTTWTTRPETLVGSGPFHMTARTRGQSLDFEPVAGWYGGKTGALTHVHIDVVADPAAQVAKYEAGVYSLVGYARQPLGPDAATRYTSDAKLKDQLMLIPSGTSFWVGFNLRSGPFAGIDAGRPGRHAFATAIDRQALESALCNQKTTCIAATGGLISKGLRGYLGDGADADAKFDPAKAKAEYQGWDPNGTKVKGLTYTYDSNAFNKTLCDNLAAQWKKNLGVTVACNEMDRGTFFEQRDRACAYPLFRQSWTADYDHPQDWFDYLFVTGAPSSGSCYSNSNLDTFMALADGNRAAADTNYKVVGQTLVTDVAFAGLLYGVQQYLVHPFVRGAGGNALYDNPWTGIRIVRH